MALTADNSLVVAEEYTLFDLAKILLRHRLTVFAFLLLGLCGSVLFLTLTTPRFDAEALLLIQPDRGGVDQELIPETSIANDSAAIDSQVRILSSRSMAAEIVELLQLQSDPSFQFPNHWLTFLGFRPSEPSELTVDQAVTLLQSRLSIKRDGKTHVISVMASDADPARAAEIANLLTDRYIVRQITARYEATRRATNWLDNQLNQARDDLRQAEAALTNHINRASVEEPVRQLPTRIDTAALGRDLIAATADRAALESELYQIRKNISDDPQTLTFEQTGGSTVLQNLYAQMNQLIRQEAELRGQYGERHPRIVDLHAEKSELELRIVAERQALVTRIASRVEQARVRERTLAAEIDKVKNASLAQQSADSAIANLERQVDLSRQAYEAYLARFEAIVDREDVAQPDAQVISKAVPASKPDYPKPISVFPVALIASLVLAFAAVYFIEHLDRGFATEREVSRLIGVPCLALLPDIKRREGKVTKPCDYGMSRPRSRYGEAVRGILPAITDVSSPSTPKSVLVTSSIPDEGKSTTALSLARVASSEGLRVLLVDADIRRPRLDRLLGIERSPGLSDVLSGTELNQALRDDPRSTLTVLTAGESSDTQQIRSVGSLVAELGEKFDLIVIDSAPVLAAADAQILAEFVDSMLLIIRWRRTSKAVVKRCCERLGPAGKKLAGVALTLVDIDAHSRLGGAEAMIGGPKLAEYYRD